MWPCDVTTESTPFKECRVVFSALDSSVAGPIEEAFAQYGIAGNIYIISLLFQSFEHKDI